MLTPNQLKQAGVSPAMMGQIFSAATQELIDHYGIPENCTSEIIFNSLPQHNADGSVTYCLDITIKNTIFAVEVYEDKGNYTAECWKVDDIKTYSLILTDCTPVEIVGQL